MIDLDDAEAIRAADPSGMLDAIAGLPEQVRRGYSAGRSTADLPHVDDVSAVAFCGMGGSGYAGEIVRAVFRVLERHVSQGEMTDVMATLPEAIVEIVAGGPRDSDII